MCEYCNVELGECETILSESEELKDGTKLVDLIVTISNSIKDKWTIDFSVGLCDTPVLDRTLQINYCPFCGQKLFDFKELA